MLTQITLDEARGEYARASREFLQSDTSENWTAVQEARAALQAAEASTSEFKPHRKTFGNKLKQLWAVLFMLKEKV